MKKTYKLDHCCGKRHLSTVLIVTYLFTVLMLFLLCTYVIFSRKLSGGLICGKNNISTKTLSDS